MVILDVIPLVFLPRNQPQIVSYFHSTPLPVGSVVQVLFHNRKIKAVVVASASLAERKLQFKKQADFTLKKIDKVLKKNVTGEHIKKAQELSDYYLISLGLTMRAVFLHPEEKNFKKYISPGPILDLPPLTDKRGRGEIRIVDMRKEIRDANYSIFSRHLKEALQTYDKIIIFIPRKGYANFLRCESCGHMFTCPSCSASLVVHQNLECHHCGYQVPQPKQCPKCKGYNLKGRGVGIEKVETELLKFFNYQNLKAPKIAKLTSESKKIGEDWQILLATQSIFNQNIKVPFLCIMNADALINIPDYSAEEKLLKQTLLLASMSERTIIQTYNPEDPALVAAATGTVDEFWKRELEFRKQFDYPPFTKLIKLTYKNRDARIAKQVAQNMATKLGGVPYPALIFRERGLYVWNVLLKSAPTLNFKPETLNLLRNLPPDWQIDVDPITVV
ncbi:MAG: hypothetical protein AAB420_02295 [Patescibacteria group bacterium]